MSGSLLHCVVMGVAGCGKTSVGTELAARLGAEFVDADHLHPAENIAKMSAGVALQDDDRWSWLDSVGAAISQQSRSTIVACSALKQSYRQRLMAVVGSDLCFVHLTGSKELIEARLSTRADHFMGVDMLASQLCDLEPLHPEELGFTAAIDRSVADIVQSVVTSLSSRGLIQKSG